MESRITIDIPENIDKIFRKLPVDIVKDFRVVCSRIESRDESARLKKVQGRDGTFSIVLRNSYRIILYQIRERHYEVLDISHRKDVYKNLNRQRKP